VQIKLKGMIWKAEHLSIKGLTPENAY